jgi:hypothetical protein
MTRVGHPNQGLSVYFRSDSKFRKIHLPSMPDANIPEKMKQGKSYPQVASNNWEEAESWNKDGALNVTVTTRIDGGEAGSITATREVKLIFDKSGKPKSSKSRIEYETSED